MRQLRGIPLFSLGQSGAELAHFVLLAWVRTLWKFLFRSFMQLLGGTSWPQCTKYIPKPHQSPISHKLNFPNPTRRPSAFQRSIIHAGKPFTLQEPFTLTSDTQGAARQRDSLRQGLNGCTPKVIPLKGFPRYGPNTLLSTLSTQIAHWSSLRYDIRGTTLKLSINLFI